MRKPRDLAPAVRAEHLYRQGIGRKKNTHGTKFGDCETVSVLENKTSENAGQTTKETNDVRWLTTNKEWSGCHA